MPRAAVLVEGVSDRAALLTLAGRRGRETGDVAIVPMSGYTNIARELRRLGDGPTPLRAGLCDRGAEAYVRRALLRAGVAAGDTRESMAGAGFFVCDDDLEDELIRALGTDAVLEIVAEQGESASLRTLRRQPAQRERTLHQHLHRFLSSRSGRKETYAPLLVAALAPGQVPAPLDGVLAHVGL